MTVTPPPFVQLRARTLVLQCLVGGMVAAGIGILLSRVRDGAAATEWTTFALFYTGGGAVLAHRVRAAGVDLRKLFGPTPSAGTLRLSVVAVPLMMLSVGGFWLLFLPLSYVAPNFVRSWGLATANLHPVVTIAAWVMQFLVAVVLAPVVEEVLFRGILLQRWAAKWGTPRAVLASSALFAVGHVELLGHFIFAVVMCALYLRTKSLWVPIATHALNNGIVSLGLLSSVVRPSRVQETMTLESLRGDWWVGAVLLVLGVALLEWYRERLWSGVDLKRLVRDAVPYFQPRVDAAL